MRGGEGNPHELLVANLFPRDIALIAALASPGSCTFNNGICQAQFSALGVRQQYPFDSCESSQMLIKQGLSSLAPEISPNHRKSPWRSMTLSSTSFPAGPGDVLESSAFSMPPGACGYSATRRKRCRKTRWRSP